MNHFNAIVFGNATVALTSNEDVESSEMELGTSSEEDQAMIGNDSDAESSHAATMGSHTEWFQQMTISSTSSDIYYIDPSSDQHANRYQTVPLSANSNAPHMSTSHQHLPPTASFSAPSLPVNNPVSRPVISAAPMASSSSSAPSPPIVNPVPHPASSNIIHMPTSCQRLTPTASFSAPPPPIVDPDAQPILDGITPQALPMAAADSSLMEDVEVIVQPTKGRDKLRAKKATRLQQHAEPNAGPRDIAHPIITRRSVRAQAGQKSKAK